jgi:hypothetical protein
VRYSTDMVSRHVKWRNTAEWMQSKDDTEHCRQHPVTWSKAQ